MFWDRVAFAYDLFANHANKQVNEQLCREVAALINPADDVIECACGTGMISVSVAPCCHTLTATDYSEGMLRQVRKKCASLGNVTIEAANILQLPYSEGSFDKVIAGNVIHLLDDPLAALGELDRVCKPGGAIIVPTYINKNAKGDDGAFSKVVGKAGADFKRQFTPDTYRRFFEDAGYPSVSCSFISGRVPCALAVMRKQ